MTVIFQCHVLQTSPDMLLAASQLISVTAYFILLWLKFTLWRQTCFFITGPAMPGFWFCHEQTCLHNNFVMKSQDLSIVTVFHIQGNFSAEFCCVTPYLHEVYFVRSTQVKYNLGSFIFSSDLIEGFQYARLYRYCCYI